ncbi:oxysterol-binding protein-related protein 11 [Sceloporus undulatus]|uniref:oxysterol-binding protein-related protein 11 n=1 Tax=Sceloporus undulatus TaxID=8520 RepID=UPI001C4D5C5E|nr:oxysterol-binding protein-related protein 11 [Sceloporus undulatus]
MQSAESATAVATATTAATTTTTATKVSESEGKLEVLLPAQNCASKSSSSSSTSTSSSSILGVSSNRGGSSTKSWQYSDHMENISGYLMKYTNLVTGWQYRYFVLNNEAGLLEYFVNEQSRNQKPRGTLQLAGAVISPSDEDSHTFTVNAASGEQYKLRATDAKERQHWVSRLQICTQHHTEAIGKNNPPLKSRSFSLASQGSGSPGVQRRPSQNAASFFNVGHHRLPTGKRIPILQPDHLIDVREKMYQAEGQQRDLVRSIECLPASGHLSSLDQDLLMLKATSMATMNCLNDCFHILQLQHASQQKGSLPTGTSISWLEPKISLPNHFRNGTDQNFSADQNKPSSVREEQSISDSSQLTGEPEEINPDEEVEDTCDNKEDDLGAVEEQRSVILHLLSQLKLGMDLTRVVLPTFILEKRSLLEMYADFMSHPDLFIAISNGTNPEERMIRFVEYYLTSFHEGRKGAIAKKPYNPIIGETFHCSWKMAKSRVPSDTSSTSSSHSLSEQGTVSDESQDQTDCYTVRFVAEQVSHHPPVSGFYAECVERKMCVNAHVWTKSKFLGMSIGVTMVGEGILSLLEHGEEYTFSLPCAYARSILTVPWVELGGKVSVNCAKTGYSASITFHTKPFYGGKLHRVTGEVKQNATNTVVCRVQGEWNSILEFTYNNGETKCMDLTKLSVTRKRVRPIEKQGPFESRKLWQHVTESLRDGDIDKATEHKKALEERQRNEERLRAETGTTWCTKYFVKDGDGWVYYNPLWKRMPAIQNQEVDTN